MPRDNQYLLHPQQHHHHGLNYSHNIPNITLPPHYSQIQPQNFIPTHNNKPLDYHDFSEQSPIMVKQLMAASSTCESSANLGVTAATENCNEEQQHENHLNEWGMMDGLVTSSSQVNIGGGGNINPNDESSHINQLSLRSEMDFWAYGK